MSNDQAHHEGQQQQQGSFGASRADIWKLWRMLLDTFIHYLETTPPEKRTALMLAVIRAFLRDNGIEADATRNMGDAIESAKEDLLALQVPFPATPKP